MKKTRIFHTVAMAAFLAAAASCEHKELCYDHPHPAEVRVVFDWQKAPGATPESMCAYFLPASGEQSLRYDFANRTGGTIRTRQGDHGAFCLNSDAEGVFFRDGEGGFELTTDNAPVVSGFMSLGTRAPRARGTEEERVALAPDTLWSDYLEERVLLTERGKTIVFYPELSVCTYTVEIRSVKNLKYVTELSGTLSGLAGGLHAERNEVSEELVTVPFPLPFPEERGETGAIEGSFLTFGHRPGATQEGTHRHTVMIYAMLLDGTRWYYEKDVTDQIPAGENPRRVRIVIDELPLPKPIVNGGGFQPKVDEWQQVDIELPM